MGFTKLDGKTRYRNLGDLDLVSIRADNNIYFNQKLLSKHGVPKPLSADIYVDKGAFRLGVKFIEGLGGSCSVRKEYGGYNVGISDALHYFNIFVASARRVKTAYHDGMFIVPLEGFRSVE